jgi:U5 small nuclear ribonucleoprotein component
MASFEDYDEFGNYIGADLDSDEEDEPLQQLDLGGPSFQPLHGEPNEPLEGLVDEVPVDALMEIDGQDFFSDQALGLHTSF